MDSHKAANSPFQRRLRPECSILILAALLIASPALAQTASPDTQLTQTMLTEIRQLRQDLQTAAATIQRVQIVMYRLQFQTAVVNNAEQRADAAHGMCAQVQQQQKMWSAQIEQAEARLRNAQNPAEKQAFDGQLLMFKRNLDGLTTEAQMCPAKEAEAETQLRTEQAKMNDLDAQLDKLDKVLSSLGAK
jgi:chromosome segregation ATPase